MLKDAKPPDVTSFNPRAREGRDDAPGMTATPSPVSIHAPARGATQIRPAASQRRDAFQSTRPRGARRRIACLKVCLRDVSIHAPARGAT